MKVLGQMLRLENKDNVSHQSEDDSCNVQAFWTSLSLFII